MLAGAGAAPAQEANDLHPARRIKREMRLASTSNLPEGATLGRDLPTGPGQAPPLRAGARLDEGRRTALLAAGINWVYVEDELGAGIAIPRPLSEDTRQEARGALLRAFSEATRMPGNLLSYERLEELTGIAKRIVAEVAELPDAPYAFADLSGPAGYNVEHSIDATVVGLLVGRHLFRTRGRVDYTGERRYDVPTSLLQQLGLGLFLQDIGKLGLPPSIVHKDGPLTDDEWELMKRHPELGLDFLRDEGIGFRARSVVRGHHERWDGGGYPDALAGEEISPFARIGAVADVFDAITSERHHAPAAPQSEAVAAIRDGAGSAFDPELSEVFGEVVAPYPPGAEIDLPRGRTGVVTGVTADGLLVRVAGAEIALAEAA